MKSVILLVLLVAKFNFIKAGNLDFGGEAHVQPNGPPIGHMQELGSHSRPLPVEERWDFPHPHEFFQKYVKESRAVVFRDAAKRSPAFTKWTPEYLEKMYGDLEVRLETLREKEGYVAVGDKGMGRDTIRNFLKTYKKEGREGDKYIVGDLPTPMWHEYMVMPSMSCGLLKKNFVEIDLWLSGGGTHSILHKDAFNQINCLMNGTKEWKLIEYKYEKKVYKAFEAGNPGGGYSRVNVSHVDLIKYPTIAEVPWNFTVLHGGDCLFLPKSMYHQVKSYGDTNLAVSILFSRFEHINVNKVTAKSFKDCGEAPDFKPLNEIEVDLQYPGKGMMTMGLSELHLTTSLLLNLLKEYKVITKEAIASMIPFANYYNLGESLEEAKKKHQEAADEAFNLLTGGDLETKMDRKFILKLPKSTLRRLNMLHEPIHPSNSYDYEYYKLNPLHIARVLAVLVKSGAGSIKKDVFMDAYVNKLYGSSEFGKRFWNDLAGEEAASVTKEKIIENFNKATRKYNPEEEESWQEVEGKPKYDDWRQDPGEAYIFVKRNTTGEKDEEVIKELTRQLEQRKEERGTGEEGAEEEGKDDDDEEEENEQSNKNTRDEL